MALPIDKILYIYLLCSHAEHQKYPSQSKQSKHFHQRNWFTQCETGSNKVKLLTVGTNAIVHRDRAQQKTQVQKPYHKSTGPCEEGFFLTDGQFSQVAELLKELYGVADIHLKCKEAKTKFKDESDVPEHFPSHVMRNIWREA